MLNPNLLPVLRYEFPDESRVPQFAGDAEVLAAAHQRVGFTAFGRGGNGLGGEVVHLPARDGHESICTVLVTVQGKGNGTASNSPSLHHERILPRHSLCRHDRLPPWRKPPGPGPKRPVQDPAVLDLGEVDDAVGFHFYVVGVERCE